MKNYEGMDVFNNYRIEQQVADISEAAVARPDLILFMDFDECAVTAHLSRMVTDKYVSRYDPDVLAHAKTDLSMTGISTLLQGYVGLSVDEYMRCINSVAQQAVARNHFVEFIQRVALIPSIMPVFVSSGLQDLISTYLQLVQAGGNKPLVFADTFVIANGRLERPGIVIGEREKSFVVEKFRYYFPCARVATLGHSSGDIPLVKAGDRGLRMCFDDSPQLKEQADIVIPGWNWGVVLDTCLMNAV